MYISCRHEITAMRNSDVKRVISDIKMMSVMKKEVQDYATEVWGVN